MGAAGPNETYLDGFQYDVFISYAHQDHEPGWMAEFHQKLRFYINRWGGCGGKLAMFFDEESLAKNQQVTPALLEACQQSAALVCVVSSLNYLNSDWCTRELAAFQTRKNRPALPGNFVPIFKVSLMELDLKDMPRPLDDSQSYNYFDPKPPQGFTRHFYPPSRTGNPADNRFVDATDKLGEDIAKTLRKIAELQKKAPKPSPPRATMSPGAAVVAAVAAAPSDERTVYVAEATDDVAGSRRSLVRELEQLKVRVLPEPLSADYHELEPRVNEALRQSAFSVHLLGKWFGKTVRNDPLPQERSIAQVQFDLATEMAKSTSKSRIVWLAADIDENTLEAEQKALVENVKHEEGSKTGLEWLRGDLQQLKDLILSRLPTPTVQESGDPVTDGGVVVITAHENDITRAEVAEIKRYCKARGFTVVPSCWEEAMGRRENEKRDKNFIQKARAEGLLILYGFSTYEWVRERSLTAINVLHDQKGKNKLAAAAVLDMPPPHEHKADELPEGPTFLVLDARGGISSAVIDPFLNKVLRRRPR